MPDRLLRKAVLTGRDAYKQCIDKASVVLVDCPEDACKDEGDESEADCDEDRVSMRDGFVATRSHRIIRTEMDSVEVAVTVAREAG